MTLSRGMITQSWIEPCARKKETFVGLTNSGVQECGVQEYGVLKHIVYSVSTILHHKLVEVYDQERCVLSHDAYLFSLAQGVASPEVQTRLAYLLLLNPPSVDQIFHFLYATAEAADCDTEIIVIALLYINRLPQFNSGNAASGGANEFFLNDISWRHVLVTGLLLAKKMWCDDSCVPGDVRQRLMGNTSISTLNQLESKFLVALGYDLGVKPLMFQQYMILLSSIKPPQQQCTVMVIEGGP